MHPLIESDHRARLADAWLRFQIEESDRRFKEGDVTAVWIGRLSELREAMGMTIDEEEDAEEVFNLLEESGEWDRIPAAGVDREQWYHVPGIDDENVIVTDADFQAGVAAIEAVESPSNRNWSIFVEKPTRLDMYELANRYKTQHIMKAHARSDEKVSLPSVLRVNSVLAHNYLPNAQVTLMNYQQIADESGLSIKVVSAAVRVLSDGGIWGAFRGRNGYRSRFYPLFIEESLELFAAYVPEAD